jgi:hypothetical protein
MKARMRQMTKMIISFFKPHSRGKHTIIVTDENDDTLFEREYTFETGIHYSLILIGDSNSTNTPLYLGVVPQYR